MTLMTSPKDSSLGLLDQPVAARCAARAGDKSGGFQLQQNLDEELRRNAVRGGDLADPDRLARLKMQGQLQQRNAGVLGSGGNGHLSSSSVCSPHSVLAKPLQRPARSSSPNITARVHGQQPMLV